MSKYITVALDIVKILGLEESDENILRYAKIIKDKGLAEKEVDKLVSTGEFIKNLGAG